MQRAYQLYTRSLFNKDGLFKSDEMISREARLKDAQANASRVNKTLQRDRNALTRKERDLSNKLKAFCQKGEHNKAIIVANQIAQYRAIGDRNFEAEVAIETRAQMMRSDAQINRAEIEAIKGIRYANLSDTVESVKRREEKYSMLMSEFSEMETILNEGMDEIYDDAEQSRTKFKYFNQEVADILREGYGAKKHGFDRKGRTSVDRGNITIHFKRFQGSNYHSLQSIRSTFDKASTNGAIDGLGEYATIYIASLEYSVDMLKRELVKDYTAIHQLGVKVRTSNLNSMVIENVEPIRLGKIVHCFDGVGEGVGFSPFETSKSLEQLGIKNGEIIWVEVLPSNNSSKK